MKPICKRLVRWSIHSTGPIKQLTTLSSPISIHTCKIDEKGAHLMLDWSEKKGLRQDSIHIKVAGDGETCVSVELKWKFSGG